MAALIIFLALLLVISAGHKLATRETMALVTARLLALPPQTGMAVLLMAASAELLAALGMVLLPTRAGGALAAAAIWASYAIALLRHRGQVLDCGCDLVRREKPVGIFALARPVLLAALALLVAFGPVINWQVDAPFAAIALVALWFAAGEIAAIPALNSAHNRTRKRAITRFAGRTNS